MKPQDFVKSAIRRALEKISQSVEDDRLFNLEKPKQEEFGDLSSPIAMNLAKHAKESPRKIAERILSNIEIDPYYVAKVEIAGPGFLNFYLAPDCLQDAVQEIIVEADRFGQSSWGKGQKVQFEFVSANPTGPLNIVSARAAAVGDVVASLFEWVGFKVEREYYVNDAGRQVRLLGASLSARYMQALGKDEPIPEDGYHGAYITDLAKELIQQDGAKYAELSQEQRQEQFSDMALKKMLRRHQDSLKKYRLNYDVWFQESAVRDKGEHLLVLQKLEEKGYTYHQDGAIWFRSTAFSDEKDRVLVTGEGEPTYFLVDIAYHEDKYLRGFDRIYDFWGPDHHGYIPRMSAALQALGHPKDSFQVGIIQQVNLLRDGQVVKMSKRAGEIIEMDELIEEVGVDAARFFFIDRRLSQPMDFDIELAKKQSEENPVLYVQYGHARICNLIRFAESKGISVTGDADTRLLTHPLELLMIKKLLDFPETVSKAAEFLEPHRITGYLTELSTILHRFYHDVRVVLEDQPQLSRARLLLNKATQQVYANGLRILNISAPQYM